MIILRSYPRIHIGLADLGNATLRKYGGAGFAISGPVMEIKILTSDELTVVGLHQIDRQGQRDIQMALESLNQQFPGIHSQIILAKLPPQHIGLGSKTLLLLSILKAIQIDNNIELDQSMLQTLCGRGGTSGIGINTFFRGGFLTDGGHDPHKSSEFTPSSARKATAIPPVICRADIPDSWNIYLLLPPGARRSGQEEKDFFRANTPIPTYEALETLALIYHGITPAVVTSDITLLKMSLTKLHTLGFKCRELQSQPAVVNTVLTKLNALPQCAVGMSSMGPLIYVIAEKHDKTVVAHINEVCADHDVCQLETCTGRNRGFDILNQER